MGIFQYECMTLAATPPQNVGSERGTQFGSRPNRTEHPRLYLITTSVLTRSEQLMLSAGVSGVPLQAGLAPGNSLHDSPVCPADITPNRSIHVGPARVGHLHPHVGPITLRV